MKSHLYGPVPSRRLGRSLGIDLVPYKICTYDCIYCQIGNTTEKTLVRKEYVPVREILEEVRRFLKEGTSSIDHLSLAGSGEPTLHSKIRSIIESLKKITLIPVAVITNGFLLWEPKGEGRSPSGGYCPPFVRRCIARGFCENQSSSSRVFLLRRSLKEWSNSEKFTKARFGWRYYSVKMSMIAKKNF